MKRQRRARSRQREASGPSQFGALSDEALMTAVATAEPDALHTFIDRFQRKVYGAAVAIVRDRALADEVTQDAFVRVWRHAAAFDPRRGSVGGWLMRITRNVAVDALRVRRPDAVDPLQLLQLHDSEPGPARSAAANAEVREVLASLPSEQARVLLLAAFYGYTAAEIAEIEQIPLGTAKTRIRLGLSKVREPAEGTTDRGQTDRDTALKKHHMDASARGASERASDQGLRGRGAQEHGDGR